MKKLIIVFLLIPVFAFTKEKTIEIKVKSNHTIEFKVELKEFSRYYFKLKGDSIFNFMMIEKSGNKWDLHIADVLANDLVVWENIMDGGLYTIRIYSVADNNIEMVYGDY